MSQEKVEYSVSEKQECEKEQERNGSSSKVDLFERHSQLRQRGLGRMTNTDRLRLSSPEISPRFVRRSFDMHMLRPHPDIFDGTNRSLSDSELDRQNDSNMTAEFMDLPRRLPKRLSLRSRRTLEGNIREHTLSARRMENTTSRSDLPASNVPKIEFSNIHVVVEDIDPGRPNVSGFFFGEQNYSSESDDYVSTGSRLWMNLEPQSHALLSPRSSNGSICSYRSSNADSAIEILTPDEEIPEHSPSESADSRFWDNRHIEHPPYSGNIVDAFHPPAASTNIHITPTSSAIVQTSDISVDYTITSQSQTDQFTSSDILCQTDTQFSDQTLRSSSDVDYRSSLQSNTALDSSVFLSETSKSDKQSSSLSSSVQYSSSTHSPTKHVQVTSVPSTLLLPHSKGRSLSPDSGYSQQGRSLPSSSTNFAQGTQLPIPPVVISDFSNRLRLESRSSQTNEAEDSGAYLSCVPDKISSVSRSLSNCSISSNESSTFSIQSDSSLDVEEQPVFIRPKTSSWKKIRNIVHWSPFIQQFKRRKYPWIQLAGHQGNFQAGEPGAILKKYDKREYAAFKKLMKDVLRPYVPEYRGESSKDGERYVQQQDLLCEFEAPCVMDIKMGCRTYLEEELVKARENPTLRKDMYQKMVEVDPSAPTEEEHNQKAITKPRYMQWRDDMSSSSEMGFRIEGIRKSDGAQVKNFKKTKDKNSVKECLRLFVEENPVVVSTYLRRLKAIRATQEVSPFFKSHEIIGSSLLFVHDRGGQASIWMIDFGKTTPLPENISVSHRNKWVEGNHEDGYLYGMDSLIEILDELNTEYSSGDETNTGDKCNKVDTQLESDTRPQTQKDTIEVISVHTDPDQPARLKDDGQSSTV